jgi:hypothetical protein
MGEPKQARPRSTAWILIAGFMLLGSCTAVAIACWSLLRGQAAQSWSETTCEILASTWIPNGEYSQVRVQWRYVVDGRGYQLSGDPLLFTPGSLYPDDAEALAGRFSVGGKVPCYYDPADPMTSVLDRSVPSAEIILQASLAIVWFFAIIVVLVVQMVRRVRSAGRDQSGAA